MKFKDGVDFGGQRVTNVGYPTLAEHVVTKGYVDTLTTGASTAPKVAPVIYMGRQASDAAGVVSATTVNVTTTQSMTNTGSATFVGGHLYRVTVSGSALTSLANAPCAATITLIRDASAPLPAITFLTGYLQLRTTVASLRTNQHMQGFLFNSASTVSFVPRIGITLTANTSTNTVTFSYVVVFEDMGLATDQPLGVRAVATAIN